MSVLRRFVIGLAAAASAGCAFPSSSDSPLERLARARCEAIEQCGCEKPELSCEDFEAELARLDNTAKEAGTELDLDCVDDYLAFYDDGGCPTGVDRHEAAPRCRLYNGEGGEGDACESVPESDSCGPGLQCGPLDEDPRCVARADLGTLPSEGEPCRFSSTIPELPCAWPLYCDFSVFGAEVCRPKKPEGATCEDVLECEGDCKDHVCTSPEPAVCGE